MKLKKGVNCTACQKPLQIYRFLWSITLPKILTKKMAGVVIFTRNVWKICASIWFWTQVPVQKIHSYLHLFCIRICICMHRKTVVRVGKGTPTWQSSFLESAGLDENWFCPPVPYRHQGGQVRPNQEISISIIHRHWSSFLTSLKWRQALFWSNLCQICLKLHFSIPLVKMIWWYYIGYALVRRKWI